MNIIKASLRNALRRRWKFALVVLMFGVGLVALTNVYDVAGVTDRVAAVGEEMESGGAPPSEEQVGEMARSAGLILLFGALTLFFGFGTMLLAFLMPGGMVANERGSTAIMLWAQHSMPLTSFYMRRYLGVQAFTLAAMLVFGLVSAAAVLPDEATSNTQAGDVASICLSGLLACAVSFGITAHGIRRAAFFGVVFYLASGFALELLPVAAELTSVIAALARKVLPFVLFPVASINDLVGGFESGVAWDWGATGMVAYHFALWTAVAWLGLRRIEARPLKL